MSMSVNTNIGSLNAQRNLNKSQSSLSTSMQRLMASGDADPAVRGTATAEAPQRPKGPR